MPALKEVMQHKLQTKTKDCIHSFEDWLLFFLFFFYSLPFGVKGATPQCAQRGRREEDGRKEGEREGGSDRKGNGVLSLFN